MKSWEELLLETTDLHNEPIRKMIAAGSPDEAWLAWGKLVQKRIKRLVPDEYRKAVHWVYAFPETKACFEKGVPIETEFNAALTSGQAEYHSMATLLSLTMIPESTVTQTPGQWAARLTGTLNWATGMPERCFSVENQPLLHQLCCAEAPWLIGCMFPDLSVGRQMLQFARENFQLGLTEILDGSGLPGASNHLLLRPLLACWTRALMIGKRAQLRPWPADVHQQFEWGVQHMLRFTRKDGSPMFSQQDKIAETVSKTATRQKKPKPEIPAVSDSFVPFEFERFAEMVRHALAFDSDESDHAIARTLFPRSFSIGEIADTRMKLMRQGTSATLSKKVATAKKNASKKKAVAIATQKEKTASLVAETPAAYFSEWAQVAMFRSGWEFRKPSLAVTYLPINEFRQILIGETPAAVSFGDRSDQSICMEFSLAGRTVWNGHWNVAVRLDGRTLLPTDRWSQTCEITDEDADYMEIELPLTENMRLQRHFLLCHSEKLLLLADSLLPQFDDDDESDDFEPHTGVDAPKYVVEYESQIPLAPSINVKASREMTELLLTGTAMSGANAGKTVPVSRVFPLALPEWKAELENQAKQMPERIAGELTNASSNEGNALILRQHVAGRAMFAPLVFDLDAKRVKEPYTWRQLTTGENLEIVGCDRAVSFRLQIARLHFLLFRSLTSSANRTFFGHNLNSDFFAGRFDQKTGKVTPLVEVE